MDWWTVLFFVSNIVLVVGGFSVALMLLAPETFVRLVDPEFFDEFYDDEDEEDD